MPRVFQLWPLKGNHNLPVPQEIELLLVHLTGAFGACGLSLNILLASLALCCRDLRAKRCALSAHLLAQVLYLHVSWSTPPGTGVDGSPAGGPLSLQLALIALSTLGLVLG